MATHQIKTGLDLPLQGVPAQDLEDVPLPDRYAVYPLEHPGIKPRAMVKDGDPVRRGQGLFFDKTREGLTFRSPVAGTVSRVVYGERRSLQAIELERSGEDRENFTAYPAAEIPGLERETVLRHLLDTGALALLRQRPFSQVPDPEARPKAIFVNGMNTAPFQPDLAVAVRGDEAAFQAGLDTLSRLTEGGVHLCLDGRADLPDALRNAERVRVSTFSGPHPAGNTSVHIHQLDPIRPQDVVWTIRGVDVLVLGRMMLDGAYPETRVVSLGGPAVREEACRHYRVAFGGELAPLLDGRLSEGELRLLGGDALAGTALPGNGCLRFQDAALTVLTEGRDRFLMGWMAPGLKRYSDHRVYLSRWLARGKRWALTTNRNGSHRALVLTGVYDRYVPLNILVDFLVRAVLAHDTEEAIKLGILETDPEDFALCSFVCPSKFDHMAIVRQGLAEIAEEGI